MRNVELTGPYMHNGGMATLDQVLDFYTPDGNYEPDAKHFGTVFPQVELRFVPGQREAIIAFLKSLTDERVRYERAPFDHPALLVPHGHVGDEVAVSGGHPLDAALAQDAFLPVPAVGASGRASPLRSFAEHLVPEPSIDLMLLLGTAAIVCGARWRERAAYPAVDVTTCLSHVRRGRAGRARR